MIIRPIKKNDAKKVASLHAQNLQGTISCDIGISYLKKLYETVAKYEELNEGYIALEQTEIVGVITATKDLKQLQKKILQELFPMTYFQILWRIFNGKLSTIKLLERFFFEKEKSSVLKKPYTEILTLFVVKKHRRKGVAKKLFAKIVNQRSKQPVNVYVDTLVNNKNAIKFYKSTGFKKIATIKSSILLLYS